MKELKSADAKRTQNAEVDFQMFNRMIQHKPSEGEVGGARLAEEPWMIDRRR